MAGTHPQAAIIGRQNDIDVSLSIIAGNWNEVFSLCPQKPMITGPHPQAVVACFRNRDHIARYIVRRVNSIDASISIAKGDISQLREKHSPAIVNTHRGEYHQRQIEPSHDVFED